MQRWTYFWPATEIVISAPSSIFVTLKKHRIWPEKIALNFYTRQIANKRGKTVKNSPLAMYKTQEEERETTSSRRNKQTHAHTFIYTQDDDFNGQEEGEGRQSTVRKKRKLFLCKFVLRGRETVQSVWWWLWWEWPINRTHTSFKLVSLFSSFSE